MKVTNLPIQPVMCATCPFRDGVAHKYKAVLPAVLHSAENEGTRICHNTGSNNAFHRRTGKPKSICRGARDFQLKLFYRLGFIEAATDEAWAKKVAEMGL